MFQEKLVCNCHFDFLPWVVELIWFQKTPLGTWQMTHKCINCQETRELLQYLSNWIPKGIPFKGCVCLFRKIIHHANKRKTSVNLKWLLVYISKNKISHSILWECEFETQVQSNCSWKYLPNEYYIEIYQWKLYAPRWKIIHTKHKLALESER